MANIWYHTIIYGNETYVPSKLCENPYCLHGVKSGKIGRSINIKGDFSKREYIYYKCNNCGHKWEVEKP